jgi:hypothetical protein
MFGCSFIYFISFIMLLTYYLRNLSTEAWWFMEVWLMWNL